ncbi:phosphatidate cytidylyltransferase [Arthrobacter sp. SDTb3-6]|uniref:phosphatidate cytidylyltransferase n=1 Tax=Arthrobacter sp. SDTb3-6 TaxID=2713571 RepID=UPI00159D9895|nr:phosphatidate cytidylyltransferase [Arthrobacter sp. SDTb3-6]NVM97696.1 phosphatidate cytidylyltransferase [Arthrobacter sp. SDTb3-6]
MTGVIPVVVPGRPAPEKGAAKKPAPHKTRAEKRAAEAAATAEKAASPDTAGVAKAASGRPAKSAGPPAVPVPPGPIAPVPASVAAPKPLRAAKAPRTPKAGRDLPAAVGVGLTLLVLVLGSLLFFPLAFVVVATVFVAVGVWEVSRAIATRGIRLPLTPVFVGTVAMPASAYFAGSEGLLFALVASAGATLLWRSLDPEPGAVKSILAGVFVLMWIPFMLSFVLLMMQDLRPPTLGLTLDFSTMNPGVIEVVIMLFLVVANDTFGYLVGVLFGKHPMAPKISPKKSWEGFAGSMGGAMLVAIPATVFFLDVHWWVGFVLAVGMVFAGTGGDFAESMVKRELGIKDMSNLLPGHGGVMDRLDSILFAAPVAYATFSVLGQL